MNTFTCPVLGCAKGLSRLQVMHFRSAHDCDPVEWVTDCYGDEIKEKYSDGQGSYTIASEYEWLSSDMVCEVVETRTHREAITGARNPIKRDDVVAQFLGDNNPAKRPDVREKIRESALGHTLDEEARETISRKNTGNEISIEHRKRISEAVSNRDTSYLQTEEYSQALSAALKGREPTYPAPYEIDELSHRVRSSWEAEIATLLVENDITYSYEEEFELSIGSYYPDFVMDAFAIEVKGFSTERSVNKAAAFMGEFPAYTCVVVGDKLPCDHHIPWDRRETLLEVIDDE